MRIVAMIALLGSVAVAQTTAPVAEPLDFGGEGLLFPPVQTINAHTPRTAQLLGEAYRRHDPLVWKRVQYVADLGQVALPAGIPYLIEAMKDPAPQVRAEAARSAGSIGDASILSELQKLSHDPDPLVRIEAASGIARLTHAPDRSRIDVPVLLKGDVAQRVAGVRALGEMNDPKQLDAILAKLSDPHPTVRREAVAAMGKVAEASTKQPRAIQMLTDADMTVREAAARVLTPTPSTNAMSALAGQLNQDYAPLHEAARLALVHPADESIRDATIKLATELLSGKNPRRQEDGSYILGRLHSDAAIEQHMALLKWDASNPAATDWPLVAQVAESVGLIDEPRAIDELTLLVKPAPEAVEALQRPQHDRDQMALAMSDALISLARMKHRPALDEATRILQTDPGQCPRRLRAASAFAIGMLDEPGGKASQAGVLLELYESIYEDTPTKFEALKALGNLRHRPAADKLLSISQNEPSPDLRWIAHWAYERCSGTAVPYTPPTQQLEPPVTITGLHP